MTPLTQVAPHTTMAGRPRATSQARTRRSLQGVFASYIRELSAAGDTTPRPRAGRAPRDC